MPNVEINSGQIKSMPLPEGWREFPVPSQGNALYSVREFRAENSTDDAGTLSFYNRGLALNETTTEYFKEILAQKNHHLALKEISYLEDIFRETANQEVFSLLDARTEDLNGRKVIIVEGRYNKSQTKMFRVYCDAKGDGRFVEEVFFSAPPAEYDQNLRAVKACIQAIVWK